jgi:hypothetical protein
MQASTASRGVKIRIRVQNNARDRSRKSSQNGIKKSPPGSAQLGRSVSLRASRMIAHTLRMIAHPLLAHPLAHDCSCLIFHGF